MEGQQASAQQAIGLALMQFLQAAQGVQGPQAPQGAQVPQLGPPQLAAPQLPHPNVIAPTQSGPTGSTGPIGGGTTGGASLPLPQVVPALDALFSAKEELTQFGLCHDSSSLADDSPQWRWLWDITPRFMYRRSVGVWMKKNAQYDLHGHRSHPWTTKALKAQNWAEWKLLRIGLSTRPGTAMTLSETALHALFRVWESYGLGTAVAPQWTGPGCAGRSGGHGKGHGPQFFFKNWSQCRTIGMTPPTPPTTTRHRHPWSRSGEPYQVAGAARSPAWRRHLQRLHHQPHYPMRPQALRQ